MEKNSPKLEYLAPDVAELTEQRGGAGAGLGEGNSTLHNALTRALAKRLIPACLVIPALFWWVLFIGVHRHWYQLETCFILFDFSVTVAFGLIVIINLRKVSQLDSQRAQAQEQLKASKEAAESANRFKSLFFANISHEIRTPLTAINGFAELLLNPERTTEQRSADARVIRRNGEHLLTLINDILDLSKIEAGKMTVDRITCSPAKTIGEVCSMLRFRAAEKGLYLNAKFDGSIPTTIRTDPTRLRQVLINVIANAIKFTSQGGVSLNVSIKPVMHDPNPRLEVNITDTGIGIPPERQASLFQAFSQGDASITRRYGGSGLGLAISQHFARALGGDITATSEAGKGSTFTVTVATDVLAGVAVETNPEAAMEAQDTFTNIRVRIEGSVLVAEDGADNQALIGEKLRETGLKVELASNGQIAFDKAVAADRLNRPFDLILMDVQMPVKDGFTTTQELRGQGYRGPIIALTANAMDRDRSKLLNAGCNDFVTKPISMEKLFAAIGRYLKVTKVTNKPALIVESAAAPVTAVPAAEKFYQDLPEEIEQIEQAIERKDRVQVREVAQLLLGKAATAGLKDIAPQAAKLLQIAESEAPWNALGEAIKQFAEDSKPQVTSKAA